MGSPAQKARATSVVSSVSGVKNVENNLAVTGAAPQRQFAQQQRMPQQRQPMPQQYRQAAFQPQPAPPVPGGPQVGPPGRGPGPGMAPPQMGPPQMDHHKWDRHKWDRLKWDRLKWDPPQMGPPPQMAGHPRCRCSTYNVQPTQSSRVCMACILALSKLCPSRLSETGIVQVHGLTLDHSILTLKYHWVGGKFNWNGMMDIGT